MIDGIAPPKVIGENAYGSLRCVDWSKDGKELFASDHQRAIYHFSLRSDGKLIQTDLSETDGIYYLCVSPDDQFLVTTSEGSKPVITDRFTHSVVGTINAYGQTTDITFDSTGKANSHCLLIQRSGLGHGPMPAQTHFTVDHRSRRGCVRHSSVR